MPKLYSNVMIVDGVWSPWSIWTNCSQTCGSGTQTRNRSCENPKPAYGGKACFGSPNGEQICNKQECAGICSLLQVNYK